MQYVGESLQYAGDSVAAGDTLAREETLGLLVKLILTKAKPPKDGSMAFEKYPLLFTGQPQVSTRYVVTHVIKTGPDRELSPAYWLPAVPAL